MASVRDALGTPWTARRQWWPFPEVGVLLAAPFLLVWPFWFASKFLGGRWTIVVERGDDTVSSEKVRGWITSRRRIREILRTYANR